MIPVDQRKQLFIDERFIESSDGVSLCMNTPYQHPEPVLVPDRAWEVEGVGAYNTVMRDADGKLRMWYDAQTGVGIAPGSRRLAYAESDDGIRWRKPELGLIEFAGSKANNIVAPVEVRQSQQGGTIYRDDRAPAAERYKLWTKLSVPTGRDDRPMKGGLWAMFSADGTRWNLYPDQPHLDVSCDTQNVFFWDETVEQYVGYIRARETQVADEAADSDKPVYRSVGRVTSPDFRHWSSTQVVFQADEIDLGAALPQPAVDNRPQIDFYTNCAMKYADAQDAYVMLPSVYYHWGDDGFPATMDVQLATSRDGISWRRAGDRRPFLRHGFDGGGNNDMIFANPYLIPFGDDELWLYYIGTERVHNSSQAGQRLRSAIYRATMRRDGFISADSGYAGGEIVTPPLTFSGNRLELNCDGGAGGWLRVEILDQGGLAHPGFSFADGENITGNSVRKTVTWQARADVGELAGLTVRLRIVSRDMKLYAFQFTNEEANE